MTESRRDIQWSRVEGLDPIIRTVNFVTNSLKSPVVVMDSVNNLTYKGPGSRSLRLSHLTSSEILIHGNCS